MQRLHAPAALTLIVTIAFALGGCGGGGGDQGSSLAGTGSSASGTSTPGTSTPGTSTPGTSTPGTSAPGNAPSTYSIAGAVSALNGSRTLQWQNNGTGTNTVSANGPLTFASGLSNGTAYNISIAKQPIWQTCAVSNPSGAIGGADATVNITCQTNPADVTVLAGTGSAGFANGTGSAASFRAPTSVAVDAGGNLYVADTDNHAIRKVTPGGMVTTLAGSGTAGFANGTGTAATFNSPHGVAVDASGNVYVADSGNNVIRIITPTGDVSTLAGNGAPSLNNGTGTPTSASFNYPSGVAVDASRNVYVADSNNYAIRRITAAGVVTSLAPGSLGFTNGTGGVASIQGAFNIAVDAIGNLYVPDTNNSLIRKVTPAGVVTTLAGQSGFTGIGFVDGKGAAAKFQYPSQIALGSNGYLYVADTGNNAVRAISPDGVVTTVAGNASRGFVQGIGSAARFYGPRGLAVDANDNIYVADTQNAALRKIIAVTQ